MLRFVELKKIVVINEVREMILSLIILGFVNIKKKRPGLMAHACNPAL